MKTATRDTDSIPFPAYRVPIILASKSSRRIELMRQAGFQFTVGTAGETEEIYPPGLQREEIPLYLARLKADAFMQAQPVADDTVVITADTVVWIDNRVLGKPANRQDAIEMLKTLAGKMHRVYTGVCLATNRKRRLFSAESKVHFDTLAVREIVYYVDRYHPFDKAGAYGIQEWIGHVGVKKIEGSFSNVMGLPMQKLYCELGDFVRDS